MDVSLSPDASPETVAALQALGQAAINRMTKPDTGRVCDYGYLDDGSCDGKYGEDGLCDQCGKGPILDG